jgi:aromatic ring-opening dioxygenase LigB subunit
MINTRLQVVLDAKIENRVHIRSKKNEISKKYKETNYRNYFLYAFDKGSVKKRYVKNSTLKKKPKIYKD